MFTTRLATEADIPALTDLMKQAIEKLQSDFLSPEQVEASKAVMGLDTQLISDRSYFAVSFVSLIVGCGGWSARATLYGGDHSARRDAALLDPETDAARVRAMYTRPGWERRGIGRIVIVHCENAARAAGFRRTELMATLAGEPLYRACGYEPIEHIVDGTVPLIRMAKAIA